MENRADLKTVPDEGRFDMRRIGVRMVRVKQMSQKGAAVRFIVREATVSDWCKRFMENGVKLPLKGKKGSNPDDIWILSDQQEQRVKLYRIPDWPELRFALRTSAAVRGLIEHEFGIALADSAMGEHLRRWGVHPAETCQEDVRAAASMAAEVDEEYSAISQRAEEGSADMWWADGICVRNECRHGGSCTPKGHTPVREFKAKGMLVNYDITVTNSDQERFELHEGMINSDVLANFREKTSHIREQECIACDRQPPGASHRARTAMGRSDRVRIDCSSCHQIVLSCFRYETLESAT